MICPSFTASDRAALEAERYLHPPPKVQRKMEAIYLKSRALPPPLICRICQISKPTLVRYLRAFEQEGLAGLRQRGYEGRPNRLHPHAASLEQHFRQPPPSTCAQAQQGIAAQTGVRRGLTPVRAFLRRLKMKYRKTGFVPGRADTPEKQAEQAAFLKKPPTQAGRSASRRARGAFLSCRGYRLWRIPGFLMVFCPGVHPLPVRSAALQRVGGAGGGQSAGSPLHPRNVYHGPECLGAAPPTGPLLRPRERSAHPLSGQRPLPTVRVGASARPGFGHRLGVSAHVLAESQPDRTLS